jgi:hypothetical protein
MIALREEILTARDVFDFAVAASLISVGSSTAGGGRRDDEAAVREYIKTGCLSRSKAHRNKQVAPNLTLLLTPELQYTVYFSSSIFRAVKLSTGACRQM